MAFFIVLILLLLSVSLNDATSAEPTSMPSQLTANVALAPSATVDLISAANSLSKAAVEEVLKASNVAALNIANATFTAVASSIAKGSVEVAELILDKTMTKVDQKSGADGMTYLMMAGQRGDTAMIAMLLVHGADPKIKNWRGEDALTYAKKAGFSAAVRVLQEAMTMDTGVNTNWQTV